MSAEAEGWVYRHSPFRGATFTVHLAIGDSANDQNDHRLWMSMTTMGKKARVDAGSTRRAMKELLDGGFVELLRQGKGTTNLYRFAFPECDVVYETRGSRVVDNPAVVVEAPRAPCADPRAGDADTPRTGRADPAHDARLTQEEPKKNPTGTTGAPVVEEEMPVASTEANAHLRTGDDLKPRDISPEERQANLDRIAALKAERHEGVA